jgi:hypothetical protein
MAMYQAINGSPPEYSTWLTALQALRNGKPAQAQFAALLAAIRCTVECIWSAAPTPSELAAQPFAALADLFKSPDQTNSLYVTML